jgi:putative ATPase
MSWCSPNAAKDTYDFLGSPEGEIALAQLTVHLAARPSPTRSTWPSAAR